jgi:hypothetical protein
MIAGVTKNEGAAFAPFELNQTIAPDPESIKMADAMFICGVDAEVKYITPRYWLGAMHSCTSRFPV